MIDRSLRVCAAIFVFLLLAPPSHSQKEKRDPLSERQIEEIRQAGDEPAKRVAIYTRILDEHAGTIKALTARARSDQRARRLDGELQDLTVLLDELGTNLDLYSDRKADIRKSLKPLSEASQRWLGLLHGLAGEPGFDLSRKEAIESAEELADEATRLAKEQNEYFDLHKDERGQERAEPK